VLVFFKDSRTINFYDEVASGDLQELFPHLTIEELTAIRYYTSIGYAALNSALRNGSATARERGFETLLNNGITKLPPSTEAVTYRGVYGNEAGVANTWAEGQEITFLDFKSTSSDEQVAFDFALRNSGDVVYEVSSNGNKYSVCQISCIEGEAEVLFPSGRRFRITSIEDNFSAMYDGEEYMVKIIRMELVTN
jgi:hypothetical protein